MRMGAETVPDYNGKGRGHHAADNRGRGGESDNHAHEEGVDRSVDLLPCFVQVQCGVVMLYLGVSCLRMGCRQIRRHLMNK